VCGERRVSFSELETLVSQAARRLSDAGVHSGQRVAVMLRNSVELFAIWNAVARVGAIVVPLSYRLTSGEAAYIVSDSQAAALVYDEPAGADIAARLNLDASWHVDDDDLWARPGLPWLATEFSASTVSTLAYTSGTTGRPKGVLKRTSSQSGLLVSDFFLRYWDIRPEDRYLLAGPAYHGGPGSYAQLHLMVGARVVIMPRFDAKSALSLIESERVTTTFMVPAHFVRILREDWQRYDRASLRLVIHAAASCPVAVKRQMFDVLGPGVLWEYYGAIEGSFSVISPHEWQLRPGSVGRPLPGVRVAILDDEHRSLPAGEIGMIYSSGLPGTSFEYHGDPEKTSRAWCGELFTVGDLGQLDEDGYLYLVDRRTDMVVSGGVNIYAAEVEDALMGVPEVLDAAVFGVPDDSMGQIVHAVIELQPGATARADDLLRGLEGVLAHYKWPRSVEFVTEMPRDPSGKVRKFELRDAWSSGQGRRHPGDHPSSMGQR
jgi:long-chain acyl-CoA synthetase